MAQELAQGVRIVGGGLHGVEMSSFGENEAVVFVREHLASRGAGGKGYAKFACQQSA